MRSTKQLKAHQQEENRTCSKKIFFYVCMYLFIPINLSSKLTQLVALFQCLSSKLLGFFRMLFEQQLACVLTVVDYPFK